MANRLLRMRRLGLFDAADGVRRLGRVAAVAPARRQRHLQHRVQRVVAPRLRGHLFKRPAHRLARLVLAEIGERRIAEPRGACCRQQRHRRRREQACGRRILQIRLTQQQAADEIGDAADEVAHRQIHAQARALPDHGRSERIGHAVQHLHLPAVGAATQRARQRQRVRQGTQVVAGDHRIDALARLEQQRAEPLESGIGGGLVGIHRAGPETLRRQRHFAVPVGALDQAHAQRPFGGPGQAQQIQQIRTGVRTIGLQCQSGRNAGPLRQPPEHRQHQRPAVVVFHVEGEADAGLHSGVAQRLQPTQHPFHAARQIDRVEARRQCGKFHREIGLRRRSGCEPGEQLMDASGVDIGLGFGQHRFAQGVEAHRCGQAGDFFHGRGEDRGILLDHEQARHTRHRLLQQRRHPDRSAQPQQPPEHSAQFEVSEIRADVRGDHAVAAQLRQHVNEVEQGIAQRGVGDGTL